MEVIENGPLNHWGSYDAVDHGYDNRMLEAMGQPPPPTLPDLSTLTAPEVRGNLQYVRSDLQPILRNLLNMTEVVPLPASDEQTIRPATSMVGQPWVERAVQEGNAVLFHRATAQSTQPVFTVANDPGVIARIANPGGPTVIVAIAPGMEQAAQLAGGSGPPPPPMVPGPPPPAVPAPAAIVGAGVLVAVVLVGGVTWWAVTR